MSEKLSYNVPEAAAALGVSKATVWRLIAAKAFPTIKLGSRTLIAAEDLRGYVARLRQAA